MAEINPPFAMQNVGATHTAENDRTAIGAILAGAQIAGQLAGRGGVAPSLGGAMAVTPSSGLTVSIASGVAFIPGNNSIKQGVYIGTNDAAKTITLDTAHATLPRIDRIVCHVYDSVYAGTTDLWAIEKLTGTAASSPVAPTSPPNCITLANITVAAGATTLSGSDISDARQFIGQGVIFCKAGQKPGLANVADGQLISLTDTGEIQMKIGGAWVTKSSSTSVPDRQVFNNSGTWTKPTGAKAVYVQVQGAGGAGGGAQATGTGQASCGSGGGAGGYADAMFDAATLTSTVTVTVGTGGTGVSGAAGNAGSGSSFGSLISASGGSGGDARPASNAAFGIDGGVGGSTFTGGQLLVPGGDGMSCWGDGQLSISGEGGASYLSAGSAKGVRTVTATSRIAGPVGKPNGGGGAGAANSASVSAVAGGNGGKGVVIVTTYF